MTTLEAVFALVSLGAGFGLFYELLCTDRPHAKSKPIDLGSVSPSTLRRLREKDHNGQR